MSYKPPFTVTADAISLVAEISALAERYAIRLEQSDSLRLRKTNRIRTIRSTLAIEGSTLSIGQVTAILNGKHVIAPPREIREVQNAVAVYDLYSRFDPFSVDDLLKAHAGMTDSLVEHPGRFRTRSVGVAAGEQVIHLAPPAERVPALINDLFRWLKHSKDHLLIRSCVFHYEFEYIHPFEDGNGRMGRLWQSLILGKLHPVFRYLPVESMIHDNQSGYYSAINHSTEQTDSGIFIEFMLTEIRNTLKAHINGGVNDGVNGGVNAVMNYVARHPGCRATMISGELGIPQRSVERYLHRLKTERIIEFRGAPRNGGYHVLRPDTLPDCN